MLAAAMLAATPLLAQAPSPRDAIIAAAQAGAAADLGKPVKLVVDSVKTVGEWAFVLSHMQSPDGGRLDYRGTRYAEAAANGGKSYSHAVLLRLRPGGWDVVEQAVGPTDVAWTDWAARYNAPPAVFASP
ncbi:hypothetical protein [Vineibacter terrae]|uniref:hypothetical protein n=1 Tax=Vineibacter terrae TaxID=2586908 RepID=UPI002E356A65|nr:hypothetical protein [Vineibacter terrae]HEX2886297.1 hypothetical protein [Vineibacter terrae]